MPTIIIEGIDGAGKSTLFDSIVTKIPKTYDKVLTHKGVPEFEDPEREYFHQLSWLRSQHFMVADRYHVGELIYGPIYRGKSTTEGYWFDAIEERLDQLKAVKIILLPELDVIRERIAKRGEDYLQPQHFEQVWNFYNKFAEDNPSWTKITDNSDATAQQLVDRAVGGN